MKEKDLQLIEDYLEGKMTKNQEELFLTRLKEDQEFKKTYEIRRKIESLWNQSVQYEAVSDEVSGVLNDKKIGHRKSLIKLWYAVAASVIILLGGYFFLHSYINIGGKNAALVSGDQALIPGDQPIKYGLLLKVDSVITLIYPIEGVNIDLDEPINFAWSSSLKGSDTLIVEPLEIEAPSVKALVQLEDSTFLMKYPGLISGAYQWHLTKGAQTGKFLIKYKEDLE